MIATNSVPGVGNWEIVGEAEKEFFNKSDFALSEKELVENSMICWVKNQPMS